MGTNYYMMTGKKKKEVCNLGHTHLVPEKYHIGKSSFGRYFSLHQLILENGEVIDSLKKWQDFFSRYPKAVIIDEYDEKIEPVEMWKLITREEYPERPGWKKNFKKPCPDQGGYMSSGYYDEFGEKGLVKTHCLTAGDDGLYVLVSGDFS